MYRRSSNALFLSPSVNAGTAIDSLLNEKKILQVRGVAVFNLLRTARTVVTLLIHHAVCLISLTLSECKLNSKRNTSVAIGIVDKSVSFLNERDTADNQNRKH